MKHLILSIFCLLTVIASADEFRHVGDYLLESHFKVTGSGLTPIPIKSVAFRVFTDGVTIRINLDEDDDAYTTFEIYRSDGIGRQRDDSGALEVIPGIQAYTKSGDTLRHLRLSKESFTLTTFPGVSDQTIVSHAIAATPKQPVPDK